MNIGIYTLFFTPGQIGGIETYLRQLIAHVGQVDHKNQYTLFISEHNRHIFTDVVYSNFAKADILLVPANPSRIDRIGRKLKLAPSFIAQQLAKHPVDLLHYPGTTIDQLDVKTAAVVTMHDLQHEYFPEFFSKRELVRRKSTYLPSAKKARHIITVSEFTRQSVIQRYNISPEKITAVHHGISPIFKPAGDERLVSSIRQKYHLPEQFIFYPANPWPHKNHARLFEAIKLLREQYGFTVHLVLSGVWSAQTTLIDLIAGYGLAGQVQILDYLPYHELPALYNAAAALVFPSLFEGFGLPVLEAMACGCPVICANTTSLPELASDAAVLVDPIDVAQIAESIYTLLQDCSLQKSLRENGLGQAKKFSWERAARETVNVYESVL